MTDVSNADSQGFCHWCGAESNDLRWQRDFEEGSCGPDYQTCPACWRSADASFDSRSNNQSRYPHGRDAQIQRKSLEALIGKTVEIVDHEACIDSTIGYGRTGMKARISNAITFLQPDVRASDYARPVSMIELDYSSFESHNKPFEESGWCDHDGKGDFTCRSLGLYSGRDLCVVEPSEPLAGMTLLK